MNEKTQRAVHQTEALLNVAMTEECRKHSALNILDEPASDRVTVELTVATEDARDSTLHTAFIMNSSDATRELVKIMAANNGYFHVRVGMRMTVISIVFTEANE